MDINICLHVADVLFKLKNPECGAPFLCHPVDVWKILDFVLSEKITEVLTCNNTASQELMDKYQFN